MAQDGKDRKGDMRREQMMEKRAERLADELELKGDARSEFRNYSAIRHGGVTSLK